MVTVSVNKLVEAAKKRIKSRVVEGSADDYFSYLDNCEDLGRDSDYVNYLEGGSSLSISEHPTDAHTIDDDHRHDSHWSLPGAVHLGLVGSVDLDAARALFRGLHPETGEWLTGQAGWRVPAQKITEPLTLTTRKELIELSEKERSWAWKETPLTESQGRDILAYAQAGQVQQAREALANAHTAHLAHRARELARRNVFPNKPPPGSKRIAGYDVQFGPPKSVTLSALMAANGEVRKVFINAHKEAVDVALQWLTEQVRWFDTEGVGYRVEMVAASFEHLTSRPVDDDTEPDPQMHTHVMLSGSAFVPDLNLWRKIQSKELMKDRVAATDTRYLAALAAILQKKGFRIRKTEKAFEIEAIDDQAVRWFSKRNRAIGVLRSRLGTVKGKERLLALIDRHEKVQRTLATLVEEWRAQAEWRCERAAKVLATLRVQPSVWREVDKRLAKTLLIAAEALETKNYFEPATAVYTVGRACIGLLDAEEIDGLVPGIIDKLVKERKLLRMPSGRLISVAIAEAELYWRDHIRYRLKRAPTKASYEGRLEVAKRYCVNRDISPSMDQQVALKLLCGGERTTLIVGEAGTGKSKVYEIAAFVWREEGRRVLVLAHGARTAERLASAIPGAVGMTADEFVLQCERPGWRDQWNDAEIVVEEIGQMPTFLAMKLVGKIGGCKNAGMHMSGDSEAQLHAPGPAAAVGMTKDALGAERCAILTTNFRQRDVGMKGLLHDLRSVAVVKGKEQVLDELQQRKLAHCILELDVKGAVTVTATVDEAIDLAVEKWWDHYEGLEDRDPSQVVIIGQYSNSETMEIARRVADKRREKGEVKGEAEVEMVIGAEGHEASIDAKIGIGDGITLRARPMPTKAALNAAIAEATTRSAVDRLRADPSRVFRGRPFKNGTPVEVVKLGGGDFGSERWADLKCSMGETARVSLDVPQRMQLSYAVHQQITQGQTVEHAIVVGSETAGVRGAYVSLSRARETVEVILPRTRFDGLRDGDPTRNEVVAAWTGAVGEGDDNDIAALDVFEHDFEHDIETVKARAMYALEVQREMREAVELMVDSNLFQEAREAARVAQDAGQDPSVAYATVMERSLTQARKENDRNRMGLLHPEITKTNTRGLSA